MIKTQSKIPVPVGLSHNLRLSKCASWSGENSDSPLMTPEINELTPG